MTQLEFQYPIIWLVPMILLVLGATYFYYFRKPVFSGIKLYVLASLRFLALSLLAFLLLRPSLSVKEEYFEKPKLYFLSDRSLSMTKDSLAREWQPEDLSASFELDQDYEISYLNFGQDLFQGEDADSSLSNLSAALASFSRQYRLDSIDQLVLMSDGIFNRGYNALAASADLGLKVHTLYAGDSSRQRDLKISDYRFNPQLVLTRESEVEVDLRAEGMAGASGSLILEGPEGIQRRSFRVEDDPWFRPFNFVIRGDSLGFRNYRLSIEGVNDAVPANDRANFTVQVIEDQKKVLLWAPAIHPDISAIAQALKEDPLLDLRTALGEFPASNDSLDLLIALAPREEHLKLLKDLARPLWILGDHRFAWSALLPETKAFTPEQEQYQAVLNKDFALFPVDQKLEELFPDFPPLDGAFGPMEERASSEVLWYRRIGGIATQQPLFWFAPRRAYLSGLGLHRWRRNVYRKTEDFLLFDQFVQATVSYLIEPKQEDRFILEVPKNVSAGSPLWWSARLYDPSGNLVNDVPVNLSLRDSSGAELNYRMAANFNAYELFLNALPAGSYAFEATVERGEERFSRQGRFNVSAFPFEFRQLQAQPGLMRAIAKNSGGVSAPLSAAETLFSRLKENAPPALIAYRQDKSNLLSLWPLFFVFLGLFAVEWFFRKYWGAY